MGRDGRRDALAATAARPGGRAALSTVPEYANTATAAAGWVGSSFPNLYGSGYNQGAPVLTFFGQYNGPHAPPSVGGGHVVLAPTDVYELAHLIRWGASLDRAEFDDGAGKGDSISLCAQAGGARAGTEQETSSAGQR